MTSYKNLGGDSGIVAYEIGDGAIAVEFSKGTYTQYGYTNASAGHHNIAEMQSLARAGQGLNAFINTNKPGYAWRK